ncbi:MAG TPA: hypothetical protein VHZ09_15735 [Acidobacteriaceae bacterium]|nr:hypothetical protein [Acidobacteriaceae bacterium]
MGLGKALKSYVWWTYERGSVPYDVMVTLILAFIFFTPRIFDYGDRPKPDWPTNEIRAKVNPAGGMIYEVPAEMLPARKTPPTSQDLENAIAPVTGPVVVDREEAVREVGGAVVAWRVWGHR